MFGYLINVSLCCGDDEIDTLVCDCNEVSFDSVGNLKLRFKTNYEPNTYIEFDRLNGYLTSKDCKEIFSHKLAFMKKIRKGESIEFDITLRLGNDLEVHAINFEKRPSSSIEDHQKSIRNERRFKDLVFTDNEIFDLLAPPSTQYMRVPRIKLPSDVQLISVRYDNEYRAFRFTLGSFAFPSLSKYAKIPVCDANEIEYSIIEFKKDRDFTIVGDE